MLGKAVEVNLKISGSNAAEAELSRVFDRYSSLRMKVGARG